MTTADLETPHASTLDVTWLALVVVRDLLRGDELESFSVDSTPPPFLQEPEPDLWLHVVAVSESFYLSMTGDASMDILETRLESNLQDWIAESKFAWGELRVRYKAEAATVDAPTTNLEHSDERS